MGQDDRNEGAADDECIEHAWKLQGATFDMDGAHEDYKCPRCGALSMRKSGPARHW